EIEQSRLAGAIGPNQRVALAALHREIDAADDLRLAERLPERLELEHRRAERRVLSGHDDAPWPAAAAGETAAAATGAAGSAGRSPGAASHARMVMRRDGCRNPPPIASSAIGMIQVEGDAGSNICPNSS